jgi:MFS family permease
MIGRVSTWPRSLLARPWLLAFVPINAATSGFGVTLPLLILLRLHGSLLDVALAAVLFNVAVILASVLWGYLSDRYTNRRLFLVVNFGGFAVIYAILGFFPYLPLLFVLYTVVGLLAPAGASASNLLILEQFSESERANAYASFQEMSILGAIAGVLVGYFWLLSGGALAPLLFVFAFLAAISVLAVSAGIRPSANPLRTAHVAMHAESLVSRLRHSVSLRAMVPFFPIRPGWTRGAMGRLRTWVVVEMRHELPLIMGASFLFNFAANLYYTSYIPYLASVGLASAAIFLVTCSTTVAQALAFPISGALATREGSGRLVNQSTYSRSVGYLATAFFTFIPMAVATALGVNLAVFALLGAAIALYSTASTLLLFRGLAGRDAGTLLGVNSALGGAAAVLGALLSGLLSFYGSYRLTFLVAAGALLVSLPLWSAAEVAYGKRAGTAVARVSAATRPAGPPQPTEPERLPSRAPGVD